MYLVTVSALMTPSRLYDNGTTDFLETRRRGPTLAMLAMLCSPAAATAGVVTEKAAAAVATGKVEVEAKEMVDVGDSKDEAAKAPTRPVVARPPLPLATAAAPEPPKVVPPRRDATGAARRAIGRPTARRNHVAYDKDCRTLLMSAPRRRRSDAAVATDGGTLLMSATHRKNKLCWRCRATTVMKVRSRLQRSRSKKKARTVMFWAELGKGSWLGR